MSFRDRLVEMVKPSKKDTIAKEEEPKPKTFALSGDPKKAIFSDTGEEKAKLKKYEDAYKLDGIVYEAINNIALSTIASGYQIKCDNEEAQVNLRDWDRRINLSDFMISDVRDAMIYGSSYKEKLFNLREELAGLIMVNPRTMSPNADAYNNLLSYEQKIGDDFSGKPKILDVDSIVRFGINRISGTQNYISSIGANYDMIMRMVRADEGISYYIDRHGFKKYLITVGVDGEYISPLKFKEIKKEFENITNKNEFVVDKSVKVENLDTGDADIGGMSDYFITKVTAGLGIPEERLGLGRGSTEATAKVRQIAFEQKINSIQRLLARSYELEVFTPRLESFGFSDFNVELTFNDISPIDNKEKAETLNFIINSTPADPEYLITRNEARAILGLPPIEVNEEE